MISVHQNDMKNKKKTNLKERKKISFFFKSIFEKQK